MCSRFGPAMITKIEAVNFRCLRNISQALGNFHVLTGPNGSGKSTFLSVPHVIGLFSSSADVRNDCDLLDWSRWRSHEVPSGSA